MRRKIIAYWIATAFVALIMTASGALAISHAPPFMKALAHLGYPTYFSNLLGSGKLTGVCVLLSPGLRKLKEWAYVGFGITVLSACYSHYIFLAWDSRLGELTWRNTLSERPQTPP